MKKSITRVILLILCSVTIIGFNAMIALAGDGDIDFEKETMELAAGTKYKVGSDPTVYCSYGFVDLSKIIQDNGDVLIRYGDTFNNSKTIPGRPAPPVIGTDFGYIASGANADKMENKSANDIELRNDQEHASWMTIDGADFFDLSGFKGKKDIAKKFLVRKAAVNTTAFASRTTVYNLPLDVKLDSNAIELDYFNLKVTINTSALDPKANHFNDLEYATDGTGGETNVANLTWNDVTSNPIDFANITGNTHIYVRYKGVDNTSSDTDSPRRPSDMIEATGSTPFQKIETAPTAYTVSYVGEKIVIESDDSPSSHEYSTTLDPDNFKSFATDDTADAEISINELLNSSDNPKVYLRKKSGTNKPASEITSIELKAREEIEALLLVDYEDEKLVVSNATDYFYSKTKDDLLTADAASGTGTNLVHIDNVNFPLTNLIDEAGNDTIYIIRKADDSATGSADRPRSKVYTLSGLTRPASLTLGADYEVNYADRSISLKSNILNVVYASANTSAALSSSQPVAEIKYPNTAYVTTNYSAEGAASPNTAFVHLRVVANGINKTFAASAPSAEIKFIRSAAAPVSGVDFSIDYENEKIIRLDSRRDIEFKVAGSGSSDYTSVSTTEGSNKSASISDILKNTDVDILVRFAADTDFPGEDKRPTSNDATVTLKSRKLIPDVPYYEINYETETLSPLSGFVLQKSETLNGTYNDVVPGTSITFPESNGNVLIHYVRLKGDSSAAKSDPTPIAFNPRLAVPTSTFEVNEYVSRIVGTSTIMEYVISSEANPENQTNIVSGGGSPVTCNSANTVITPQDGKYLYIRAKANSANAKSKWKLLTTNPMKVLTIPTRGSSDGKYEIDFENEKLVYTKGNSELDLQYSLNGTNYNDIGATGEYDLSVLIPESTQSNTSIPVRYKAPNSSSQPSPKVDVTIPKRPAAPLLQVDSDTRYLKTSASLNGSENTLKLTKTDSTGTSEITIVSIDNASGVISTANGELDTSDVDKTTTYKLNLLHTASDFASEEASETVIAKPKKPVEGVNNDFYIDYETEELVIKNDKFKMQLSTNGGIYAPIAGTPVASGNTTRYSLTDNIPNNTDDDDVTIYLRFAALDTLDAEPSDRVPVVLKRRPAPPKLENTAGGKLVTDPSATAANLEIKSDILGTPGIYENVTAIEAVTGAISVSGSLIDTIGLNEATTYSLRVKANAAGGKFASKPTSVTVQIKPEAPKDDGNSYEIDYETEELKNKSTTYIMEYSTDDGQTYSSIAKEGKASLTSVIPPASSTDPTKEILIRFVTGNSGDDPSNTLDIDIPKRPATPTISIDPATRELKTDEAAADVGKLLLTVAAKDNSSTETYTTSTSGSVLGIDNGYITLGGNNVDTSTISKTTVYSLKVFAVPTTTKSFASEAAVVEAIVKPNKPQEGTDFTINYDTEKLVIKNTSFVVQVWEYGSSKYSSVTPAPISADFEYDLAAHIPDSDADEAYTLRIRFAAPDTLDAQNSDPTDIVLNKRPKKPMLDTDTDADGTLITDTNYSSGPTVLELERDGSINKYAYETVTAVNATTGAITVSGTDAEAPVKTIGKSEAVTYKLRVKAAAPYFASEPETISRNIRPAKPNDTNYTISYENETLKNDSNTYIMQYSSNGGTNYTNIDALDTISLTSDIPENNEQDKDVFIRFITGDPNDIPSDTHTISLPKRPATPTISIDPAARTLKTDVLPANASTVSLELSYEDSTSPETYTSVSGTALGIDANGDITLGGTAIDTSKITKTTIYSLKVFAVEPSPAGGSFASKVNSVRTIAKPNPPEETGTSDFEIDYAEEKLTIKNTSFIVEISTNNGSSYTKVTDNVLGAGNTFDYDLSTLIPESDADNPYTLYMRFAAINTPDAQPSDAIPIVLPKRPKAPKLEIIADANGTLATDKNYTSKHDKLELKLEASDIPVPEYKTLTGVASNTGAISISGSDPVTTVGKANPITYSLRFKADAGQFASRPTVLTPKMKPAAPTSSNYTIDYTNETLTNKADSPYKMQYSRDNFISSEDIAVGETKSLTSDIPEFGAGTDRVVQVRFVTGGANDDPSDPLPITLQRRPETPTLHIDPTTRELMTAIGTNATGLVLTATDSNSTSTISISGIDETGVIKEGSNSIDTSAVSETTVYSLKVSAADPKFASKPAIVTATVQPKPPVLGTNFSIDYDKEILKILTTNFKTQISTDNVDYKDVEDVLSETGTSGEFDLSSLIPSSIAAGDRTLYIRFAAPSGIEGATASDPISTLLRKRPEKPTLKIVNGFLATDAGTTASTLELEIIGGSQQTSGYVQVTNVDSSTGVLSINSGTISTTGIAQGTTYNLRVKANVSTPGNETFKSEVADMGVKFKPEAPQLSSDYEIDFEEERLENKHGSYKLEYSTNGGGNYLSIDAGSSTSISSIIPEYNAGAKDILIRFNTGNSDDLTSDEVTVPILERPAPPSILYDVVNERLKATSTAAGNLEIKIGNASYVSAQLDPSTGVISTEIATTWTEIDTSTLGETTQFLLRVAADAGVSFKSNEVSVSVTPRAKIDVAAPFGIFVDGKTGMISPVTDKMEYRIGSSGSYTPVDPFMTFIQIDLEDYTQDVYVRLKSTATANASADLVLVIPAKKTSAVVLTELDNGGVEFTFGPKYWSLTPGSLNLSNYEISSAEDGVYRVYSAANLKSIMGADYSKSSAEGSIYIRRRATGTQPASEAGELWYPSTLQPQP